MGKFLNFIKETLEENRKFYEREKQQSNQSAYTESQYTQRLSQKETESIRIALNQVQDTISVLNKTVKPDIFFKRLHFLFDTLLLLQQYEKYGVFTENNPTKKLRDIKANIDMTVSRFIDRYMNYVYESVSSLKTEKGREEKYADLVIKLISAFDCADSFWSGNTGCPHYSGPLYTTKNYQQAQKIYYDMCDLGCPYVFN